MSHTYLEAVRVRAADAVEPDHCEASAAEPLCFAADADETQVQRTVRMHYAACVEELFDDYAPTFERCLVQDLGYDIPAIIEAALLRTCPDLKEQTHGVAADLGCGTGLAGAKLRPHLSGRLIGCDLSRRMLSLAAKKRCYDKLDACDCVAFLHRHVPPSTADLIVAADVFVYMRSLAPLFAAAARSLRPGGLFAFSTERCEAAECGAAGWVERPSERIAHCEDCLLYTSPSPRDS